MKTYTNAQSARFLADLERVDKRQAVVQREISSGYRVNMPSDSPQDMIDIVQLKSDVARSGAITQTLGRVQAEVNTSEAGLEVAVKLVERARTIAAQTATGTAENRKGVALEVREIHQQLIDITKTVSSGRYVYSGDADQTQLYSADWTQAAGGVVRQAQPGNTRRIQDINGTSFSVTRTAGEIFDTRDALDQPDSTNVFNAVYQLGKALENDDETGVQNATVLLVSSLDHLGRQLTFFGNAQNRVSQAITLASEASVRSIKELSDRRDTDLTKAIVDLSTLKLHREAALGAQGQQPRTSLFDYLG
ncbi:MAG: hypothetical protein SGI92_01625 [Bryobacteraceae bacterium]|nr:hypothetical protein [Bryobacteraceae bacterium]